MAFSALEALQAFGAGRQIAQQEREYDRQQNERMRMQEGRTRAVEQVRGGDFTGAAATAFEAGDSDLLQNVGRLSQAHKQQALTEATAGLSVARALRALPPEQRPAAARQYLPVLQQAGFSPEEIQQHMADLSDGALDGHISITSSIVSAMGPQQRGQQPTTLQRNYEFLQQHNPQVAEGYIQRQGVQWARTEDPVTGEITMTPVMPGAAPTPQAADDDEWEYEGGPGQTAPETFPDPSRYPPGQW